MLTKQSIGASTRHQALRNEESSSQRVQHEVDRQCQIATFHKLSEQAISTPHSKMIQNTNLEEKEYALEERALVVR
jgi:hypothetical protein